MGGAGKSVVGSGGIVKAGWTEAASGSGWKCGGRALNRLRSLPTQMALAS